MLNNLDNNEAKCESQIRCGISRAYYAAFHHCLVFLRNNGIDSCVVGDSSHNNVIDRFKKLYELDNNTRYLQIYNLLRRMKDNRVQADYQDYLLGNNVPSRNGNINMLKKAISTADKIKEHLRQLQENKTH